MADIRRFASVRHFRTSRISTSFNSTMASRSAADRDCPSGFSRCRPPSPRFRPTIRTSTSVSTADRRTFKT